MPLPSLSDLKTRTGFTDEPLHRDELPRMAVEQEAGFRDAMRHEEGASRPVAVPNGKETVTDEDGQAMMQGLFARRIGADEVTLTTARAPVDEAGRPSGPPQVQQQASFPRDQLSPGARDLLLSQSRPAGGFHRAELPQMSAEQEMRLGDALRRDGAPTVPIPGSRHVARDDAGQVVRDDAGRPMGEQDAARRTGPDSLALATARVPLDQRGRPAGPFQQPHRVEVLQRRDLSPGADALLLRPKIPGGPIPRDPAARKTDNDQQVAQFRQDHPDVNHNRANALRTYGELSANDPKWPLLRELKAGVGGGERATKNLHVQEAMRPGTGSKNRISLAPAVDLLTRGQTFSRARNPIEVDPASQHVIEQFVKHQPRSERENAVCASSNLRHAGRVIEQNPDLPSLEQLARRPGDPRQDPDVTTIKDKLRSGGEIGQINAAANLDSALDRLRATYRAHPGIPAFPEAPAAAGPSTASGAVAAMDAPTPTGFAGGPRAPSPSGPDSPSDEEMAS